MRGGCDGMVWYGMAWLLLFWGEDRAALRGDSIIGGWRIADGDNGIKIAPQQFGGRKKKKRDGMGWDGSEGYMGNGIVVAVIQQNNQQRAF